MATIPTFKKADAPARETGASQMEGNHAHIQDDFTVSENHLQALKQSAISLEVIRERGYRTITDAEELRSLGFSPAQVRVPGLLIPSYSTDGTISFYVFRPDNPRVVEDRKRRNQDGTYKLKVIKYEMPKGEKMRLDVPPRSREKLGDPKIPLWITEGQKKADSLASLGLCAVALLGVWNFIGRNERGGKVFLYDFYDIAFNDGRPVRIVFDSDVMTKPGVKQALDVLIEKLQRKGAKVEAVYLPGGTDSKTGVDDWLAAGHTRDDLEGLVQSPRPEIKVAPPIIELLDEAPPTIRRPLCLVNGKAYAAIWPHVLIRRTQKVVSGQVIQLSEPEEYKEQSLHIVRGDGVIFGTWQVDNPLSQLGIDVLLPEPPTAKDSLWSTPGVKAYATGYRPDPLDVFGRIKSVIARFIDFGRSLADQETMSEMLACFVMATWFLDAFSVAPYIWANGERGSGKTSLLLILVRLSYLGVPISPSGSFAALRDLADYGATLGLDDAEDLTDPKKSDPDKRAILLSGNRKGITVPLKEPNPTGQGWKTREVDCYCPRIFSTILKPDPTLSSRTIIVPVVRTAERSKGNADPMDNSQWPVNRQKLIDDLWNMALTNLADMPAFEKLVGEKSKLIGRDLQPWRAILAVAAWLDSLGMTGLWPKIEALAAGNYQVEREDLEKADLNRLIVRSIGLEAERNPEKPEWSFFTNTIVDILHRLIEDEEIEQDRDYITNQVVGHRLRKMRLRKDDTMRPRGWKINRSELGTLLASYRLPLPQKIDDFFADSGLRDIDNIVNIVNIVTDVDNVRDVDNVNPGKFAEKNTFFELPEKPCFVCNSTAWYIGPGGNVVCGVCHPLGK